MALFQTSIRRLALLLAIATGFAGCRLLWMERADEATERTGWREFPSSKGNPESYYHYLVANLKFDDGQSGRKDIEGYEASLERAVEADADSVILLIELAEAEIALGRYEEALEHLKKVVDSAPDLASGHLQTARVYLLIGEDALAVDSLERAVRLEPDNLPAMLKLGQLHHSAGRLEEAERIYRVYLEQAPTDSEGHFALAVLLVDQKRLRESLPIFQYAVELNPYNATILAAQADTLIQLKEYRHAATVYRRLLILNPDDTFALGRLLALLTEFGRAQEAKGLVESYVRNHPTAYEWSFRLAQLYLTLSENRKAISLLEQLITVQPDVGTYRLLLGAAYLAESRRQEAFQIFEQVPDDGSDAYVKAEIQISLLYYQKNDMDQAERRLEILVERGIADEDVFRLLSNYYEEDRKTSQALEILETGLAGFPKSETLRFAYAIHLDSLRRKEEAFRQMQQVIDLNPNNANALNYVGFHFAEKGVRLLEAEELVRRALQRDPDAYYIQDSLGWVLFRQGRYEEALKWLEAASGEAEDAEVFEHLGDCLAALGRLKEAEAAYRKALEYAQREPDLHRIEAKMAPGSPDEAEAPDR